MEVCSFRESLGNDTPPPAVGVALEALWQAAKGNFDEAHKLIRHERDSDSAWVHAHIHRLEGDLSNANYWYGRAHRSPLDEGLEVEEEWEQIAGKLLAHYRY